MINGKKLSSQDIIDIAKPNTPKFNHEEDVKRNNAILKRLNNQLTEGK